MRFLLILLLPLSASASQTIVGGGNAQGNEAFTRRTVALYLVETNGKGTICTGSIINQSKILTAAHCVNEMKTGYAIFGINQGLEKGRIAKREGATAAGNNVREVSRVYLSPGYHDSLDANGEYDDVAILSFKGGLPLGYEAAQFLNQDSAVNALKPSTEVLLAGYGMTSLVERETHGSTTSTMGTLRFVSVLFGKFGSDRINLYLGGMHGKSACSGDSGGPAMINIQGNPYVIGVLSRANCLNLSVYSWMTRERVSNLLAQLQN